jgi:annexin A7/11
MSIIKALELTFSGNLREILIYMFYSPYELDARLLNAALKSFRMDYKLIVEIFASRPKWYLELIDQEYKKLYKVTLKSELEKKKTKNFNKFLLCLFETEREEGPHIDVKEAEKIVEEMFKKGLKAYGTDLELFKKVFVTKSREDFILISRVFYKNNPKKINLYQACDEQVGSDNRELLKALVYAICDSSHYFGHNLKKAIVGFGTNVKVLNRILALRSEIDMDVIRERYLGETKRDLIEAIKGDTSGDYCKFLCMLASRNPKVTE